MAKRNFIMVEASEEDKEAFKLWCQINGHEMSRYIRELISEQIQQGKNIKVKLQEVNSEK